MGFPPQSIGWKGDVHPEDVPRWVASLERVEGEMVLKGENPGCRTPGSSFVIKHWIIGCHLLRNLVDAEGALAGGLDGVSPGGEVIQDFLYDRVNFLFNDCRESDLHLQFLWLDAP